MSPKARLAALGAIAALLPAFAESAPPQSAEKLVQQKDLEWKPLVEKQLVGGPTKHLVWGDPRKGASGILVKLAGDAEIPVRVHTSAYHAVVISGTWLHGFGDEPPVAIAPGGYWFQPAKRPHVDRCQAGEECIILIHSAGKFDVRYLDDVTTAAKKK
jgi:quercetin dioxygenase-like cupin family protein